MPLSKIKSSGIDPNAITGSAIADGTVTSADLDTNIEIDGTLRVGDGSGNETLTIYSGSTNEGYLRFADATSGSGAYQGRVEYDHNSGKLNMGAGGTTPVTIDAAENMGVGTNSPTTKLDITDSSTNQPTIRLSTATATNYLTIGRDSSTGHYNFKSDETGSSIQFYTDPDGSGPANRLSIDRYGYVTMPNQPSFAAGGNGNSVYSGEYFLGDNTYGNRFNVGNHYDYSNGRFTAPVAGKYLFIYTAITEDTNSHFVNIEKNGADYVTPNPYLNYGVSYQPGTNVVILDLASNDYIRFKRRASSGYNIYMTYVAGYLMG